jgi:hypothetical protein
MGRGTLEAAPATAGGWHHPKRKSIPENSIIPLGSLGLGGEAFLYAGEKRCKEFLSVSWWYFVGPPPAFGGRRPHAGAAASPQGWPPPKPLSPSIRFLIANGIRLREGNVLPALGPTALRERGNFLILAGAKKVREGALAHAP